MYEINFDKNFDKSIEKQTGFHKHLPKFNSEAIPSLKQDPCFGKNIKKLKGALKGIYRYRIADYRIFYVVNEKKKTISLLEVVARKDAY